MAATVHRNRLNSLIHAWVAGWIMEYFCAARELAACFCQFGLIRKKKRKVGGMGASRDCVSVVLVQLDEPGRRVR